MLLGGHESTAGGLFRAIEHAVADACEAVQIFTASPRRWEAPPLPSAEIDAFRAARAAAPTVRVVVAHAGYLPNPATADPDLAARARATLVAEVDRCEALGIEHVVLHPGSGPREGEGREAPVARASACLAAVLAARPRARVVLCVECTAGQGQGLGADLDELGAVVRGAEALGADPARLGACLDTAHLHAAGHDLQGDGWDRVLAVLDRAVGLGRLHAVHLNETARPLGSRLDRHAPLGEGLIGDAVFRRILCDPRVAAVPALLETPFDASLPAPRRGEIARLRALRDDPEPP